MMTPLEPDIDTLEVFVDAILRHRGNEGFLSLRSFLEHEENAPAFRITPVSLKGNFKFLISCVIDDARRAAQAPKPVVFAPPLCIFDNRDHAREQDILAGLVLSVECDRNPHEARKQLEELLGPPTVVVSSGGQWIDNDDVQDKLHLHWRLAQPARSLDDLAALKGARMSAARLVGGDGSNNPVCHPIRWAGSYHRKQEPRLCSIIALEPDVEITLADAVAALPPAPTETRQGHTVEDWLTFLDGTYEGSQRGAACARYAGMLIRTYLDPLVVESSLRLFNELRCQPPLPNDEVRRIVEDVAQKHADQLNRRRA
jgi:hypothetical protein